MDIVKNKYSNKYYKKHGSDKKYIKNEKDVSAMGNFQYRAMFYLGRNIIFLTHINKHELITVPVPAI